jgi:putative ABC transport system permease protein
MIDSDRIERSFVLRVLRKLCPDQLYEGIEGDLLEKYDEDVKAVGERKAKQKLVIHTLKFIRPGIILRNRFSFQLINFIMLSNYFVIAWRNLLKNKVFSAINIIGLALGLAACLFIFQFVSFELGYDKFNEKLDRTYRVSNDRFQNGKLNQHGTITYPTIGPTMAKDFPEIEEYTRLMPTGELNVMIGDKNFRGANCHYADDHFFSVFSFNLLVGNRSTMLKDPYTVVLTEKTATQYFELKDKDYSKAIGKTFYWGLDPRPYSITGICQNVPVNSHIQFDALISYSSLYAGDEKDADISWTWSDMYHYLVLKPGTDYKQLESKFPAFSERYFKGDKVSGSVEKFYLQPMKDAHLYSDYEYDFTVTASGKAVWAMVIVAIFILVIAWINYINLTTSRALDRAKEVGLRKVMGAFKSQLVKQFIFESLLLVVIAFLVAFGLVLLLQAPFNKIIGNDLTLWKLIESLDSNRIMILIAMLMGCALLSGFYPAFILSSYHPVEVLKGKFTRSGKGNLLRKALVVFQFTSSAALITGTLIVLNQIKFMNDAQLGISIENVMVVQAPELTKWDSTFVQRVESYKHELSQIPGVVNATTSWRIPGDRVGRRFDVRLSEQPAETHFTFSNFGIDNTFFDTYNVSLIAGRKYTAEDCKGGWKAWNKIIINQSAVKLLGIKSDEEAIGKEIVFGAGGDAPPKAIIGVMSDFHQESLQKPMEAIFFRPSFNTFSSTSIKIRGDETKQTIASIEETYKKFFPGNSFEYSFLEDRYNSQYNDDNRFAKIILVFTVLAIVVSCLGLVGLSSYTATQRTKEIGIRKVLGASMVNVVSLLSVDFVRLVFVASLLSLPIAYFSMQNWLERYAYRITPGWWQFVLPVVVILLIAAITISFQILRTAKTNPANTLKSE